jgi:isopentenyl diphosphate isomerase/L-lactate dehydrogenase-like FMN-dependent dehydrogenase
VVSNHGGRQLDGAVASLDALPPIVAEIGDRATVLVDGGIRRGSDVVKALALGADAVLTGRATLYGLATSGEGGVAAVLGILRTEVERTLALLGCPRARDVDSSYVVPNGA